MISLEQAKTEREKVQREIKQLENRQKILLNKRTNMERKARTHRLIEHGAILESIFPEIVIMTGKQIKTFLKELREIRG